MAGALSGYDVSPDTYNGDDDTDYSDSPLFIGAATNEMVTPPVPPQGGALSAQPPDVTAKMNALDAASARLQAARDARNAQQNGGVNLPLLAAAGALLAPTRGGGFGESLGNAMTAAVPVAQKQQAVEEQRALQAAQMDWNNALRKEQLANQTYARQQADKREDRIREETKAREDRILAHQERMAKLAEDKAGTGKYEYQVFQETDPNDPEGKKQIPVLYKLDKTGKEDPVPVKNNTMKVGAVNPNANTDPDAELSDDAAQLAAERVMAGDPGAMTNIGRGKQGAKNVAKVYEKLSQMTKNAGQTGADVAANRVELQASGAGARSAAQRESLMATAMLEAQKFAPIAVDLSRKVDRTNYPALNTVLNATKRNTGDPNIIQLQIATNGFLNAYVKAITPVGVTTEGAQQRARELLDRAWSQGQYEAAIKQLQVEMDAAMQAPTEVKAHILDNIRKRKVTPIDPSTLNVPSQQNDSASPAGNTTPFGTPRNTPAQPQQQQKAGADASNPVIVSTPAEAEALPPGTFYGRKDANGNVKIYQRK
jgi:hypothetical protein